MFLMINPEKSLQLKSSFRLFFFDVLFDVAWLAAKCYRFETRDSVCERVTDKGNYKGISRVFHESHMPPC